MAKNLYDEALIDAKKLKEVAVDDAKRALIEAVTPKIRDFIESQFLQESENISDPYNDAEGVEPLDIEVETAGLDPTGKNGRPPVTVLADIGIEGDEEAISLPDEEGKVTLDIDALEDDGEPTIDIETFEEPVMPGDEEELELSLETFDVLGTIKRAKKRPVMSNKHFNESLKLVKLVVEQYKKLSQRKLQRDDIQHKISTLISRVENMYGYLQETMVVSSNKELFEQELEKSFQDLNKLTEQEKMTKTKKNRRLNEEDVTLKLTGLPDDLELDDVGVDLITGDDEDGDEVDFDLSGDEDTDGDDMDLGDDEDGDELSDDDVVEIDESMLRREIMKMRRLREADETKPWTVGNGPKANVMDDFGGAHEDKSFPDVTTESEEASDDDGEVVYEIEDVMDESEEAPMNQLQNRRKRDEHGAEATDDHSVQAESRRLNKRFLAQRAQSKLGQNGRARTRTESVENKLRAELAGTNLFNAKLMYTNKLLQNENLTKRQKAAVIDRLDEANNVREVQLVYKSVTRALARRPALREGNEGRRVLGSSSAVSRPASSEIVTEGFETSRWATLAGINGKNRK